MVCPTGQRILQYTGLNSSVLYLEPGGPGVAHLPCSRRTENVFCQYTLDCRHHQSANSPPLLECTSRKGGATTAHWAETLFRSHRMASNETEQLRRGAAFPAPPASGRTSREKGVTPRSASHWSCPRGNNNNQYYQTTDNIFLDASSLFCRSIMMLRLPRLHSSRHQGNIM